MCQQAFPFIDRIGSTNPGFLGTSIMAVFCTPAPICLSPLPIVCCPVFTMCSHPLPIASTNFCLVFTIVSSTLP